MKNPLINPLFIWNEKDSDNEESLVSEFDPKQIQISIYDMEELTPQLRIAEGDAIGVSDEQEEKALISVQSVLDKAKKLLETITIKDESPLTEKHQMLIDKLETAMENKKSVANLSVFDKMQSVQNKNFHYMACFQQIGGLEGVRGISDLTQAQYERIVQNWYTAMIAYEQLIGRASLYDVNGNKPVYDVSDSEMREVLLKVIEAEEKMKWADREAEKYGLISNKRTIINAY
jgi:hypothetical protein